MENIDERLDRELLAKWCSKADVDALGKLFDRTAPRLLKLAIHLAGDPSEAEDLVQAAFVALIEQRASIDASRPILPWLTGVISHKARDSRRKSVRGVEVENLFVRAEGDASLPAQARETSGELARAVDRLDEPYRQVLILRLRHGLDVADIAHVLERSPGTVRVQLHRGIERLRELLPAGLASIALLGIVATRGLAAVRASVLTDATASVATLSTSSLGKILVSTKVVVASSAAAAALALVLLWNRDRASSAATPAIEETSARTELAAAPTPGRAEASPANSNPASAAARAVAPASSNGPVLRGKVIDAETEQPIAGARVRLFAPRTGSSSEIASAHPEWFEIAPNGVPRALGQCDWPAMVDVAPAELVERDGGYTPRWPDLSALARFDREPVLAYLPPTAGDKPLSSSTSAADGSFALPARDRGGLVECTADGYALRIRGVVELDGELAIAMWREYELAGVVIDSEGHAMHEPLDLVFHAEHVPQLQREVTSREPVPVTPERVGLWKTRSDADGRFRVVVAGPSIEAFCTTPGWSLTTTGINPDNGQNWVFESNFGSKHAGREIRLVAGHAPALHFVDAATRSAIERVHLLGREKTNGYVRWSGVFVAHGGWLAVPCVGAMGDHLAFSYETGPVEFTAWADGYRANTAAVADIERAGTIEIALERGESDVLAGRVRRGSQPVAGAEIAFVGHSPLQWRYTDDQLMDAARTDANGAFRAPLPPGSHLLRVSSGATHYFEVVTIPAPAPLDIDLANTASLMVEVVDTAGAPRRDHVVALRSNRGRDMRAHTNAEGHAVFADLAPEQLKVLVPHVSTENSFSADETFDVELARGEQRTVTITIPVATGPRHARVAARGVANYSGWRARYDADAWQPLAEDGTVPMDLTTERFQLEVAASDARRWSLLIPKKAPDGFVIELDSGGAHYTGVVIRASGDPVAGMRVHAHAIATTGEIEPPGASCVTDAEGRFELGGLLERRYQLRFHSNPEQVGWYEYDNRFKDVWFDPSEPASAHSTPLEISIDAPAGDVTMRGRVMRGGAPFADATVSFDCSLHQSGGSLRVGISRCWAHTGADGRFELIVPRTPLRRVTVSSRQQPGLRLERDLDVSLDPSPPELVLDL